MRKKRTELSQKDKREIKLRREDGMSAKEIARGYGISPITVWYICRDNRKRYSVSDRIYLGGKTLEILNGIMKNGYWTGANTYTDSFKTLRKYLPVKRIHAKGRSVYFTEDRKHDAFKGLVSSMRRKTISHRELGTIADLFGIKINARKEKMLL